MKLAEILHQMHPPPPEIRLNLKLQFLMGYVASYLRTTDIEMFCKDDYIENTHHYISYFYWEPGKEIDAPRTINLYDSTISMGIFLCFDILHDFYQKQIKV